MSAAHNLGRRMAKGVAWIVLFKLAERGLGLISTLILARILVPADFGLVAMATAFAAVLDVLTSFSFDLALIQRQDAERRHYDTAWTLNLIASMLIAGALFFGAPGAAAFFNEPAVAGVLRFLALCFLVQGFQNIGIVAFQKELRFEREFNLGVAKKLVGMAVAIAIALWLRSYWALLAGMLATRITGVILSYTMHAYRPRWSLAAARELMRFSKWMLVSNVLIFVNNRGMDLVVGRMGGANPLGLYSVAYEVSNLPTTELVFPISRAVYPGYATISGDAARLREMYLTVLTLTALVAIPIGTGIAVFAELVVRILLGSKWLETVALIQVLAISGVVRSIHGGTGAIYLALDRPQLVGLVNFVIAAVGIPLAIAGYLRFGLIAVPFAVLAAGSVAAIVNFSLCRRLLALSWGDLGRTFVYALAGTAAGLAFVVAARGAFGSSPLAPAGMALELLFAGVAAVTYVAAVMGIWHLAGRPNDPAMRLFQFARQLVTRTP